MNQFKWSASFVAVIFGNLLAGALPALSAQPHVPANGDLAQAAGLARRYIEKARADSDPRYLRFAQAALAPWWRQAAPPTDVRLLRATILQSTHRFDEAMADLDAIVAAEPQNPQAWLMRATIQMVRGDYAGATASCKRLPRIAPELATVACFANVASVTGRAAAAEDLLETALRRNRSADRSLRVWALTLFAEAAVRRGDTVVADTRLRAALALAPRDAYLLAAYADFMLDQGRASDVLKLLRGHEGVDGLLLRRALALRQLPGEQTALRVALAELQARFDAAGSRGDSVHQREQAWFELHLRNRPVSAVALACRNWQIRKEPADMRILLEAALAAGNREAARPVLAWIEAHRVHDVALVRLVRRFGGGS